MSSTLALPAELTIYSVGALHAQWLSMLNAGTVDGMVDASATCEVDSAGMQLLQSLANALEARQMSMQLCNPGSAIRSACEALSLQHLLADTVANGTRP